MKIANVDYAHSIALEGQIAFEASVSLAVAIRQLVVAADSDDSGRGLANPNPKSLSQVASQDAILGQLRLIIVSTMIYEGNSRRFD